MNVPTPGSWIKKSSIEQSPVTPQEKVSNQEIPTQRKVEEPNPCKTCKHERREHVHQHGCTNCDCEKFRSSRPYVRPEHLSTRPLQTNDDLSKLKQELDAQMRSNPKNSRKRPTPNNARSRNYKNRVQNGTGTRVNG